MTDEYLVVIWNLGRHLCDFFLIEPNSGLLPVLACFIGRIFQHWKNHWRHIFRIKTSKRHISQILTWLCHGLDLLCTVLVTPQFDFHSSRELSFSLLSLILAIHLTLSTSHYQLTAAAAEHVLDVTDYSNFKSADLQYFIFVGKRKVSIKMCSDICRESERNAFE